LEKEEEGSSSLVGLGHPLILVEVSPSSQVELLLIVILSQVEARGEVNGELKVEESLLASLLSSLASSLQPSIIQHRLRLLRY